MTPENEDLTENEPENVRESESAREPENTREPESQTGNRTGSETESETESETKEESKTENVSKSVGEPEEAIGKIPMADERAKRRRELHTPVVLDGLVTFVGKKAGS